MAQITLSGIEQLGCGIKAFIVAGITKLINIVDKNKLYVNYSDIEDETFEITENDKKFSESFYKI